MNLLRAFVVAAACSLVFACGAIAPDSLMLDADGGTDQDVGNQDAGRKNRDASIDKIVEAGKKDVVLPGNGDAWAPRCCDDFPNGNFAPDTNCTGTYLAWAYTPKCDLELTRLELHATGGLARVYDSDASGQPGVLLFEGALPSSSGAKFIGANVSPSLKLVAGHKYFIGKSEGMCSIATGGEEQEYYGGFNGQWDGPWKGHHFTAHLLGNCN